MHMHMQAVSLIAKKKKKLCSSGQRQVSRRIFSNLCIYKLSSADLRHNGNIDLKSLKKGNNSTSRKNPKVGYYARQITQFFFNLCIILATPSPHLCSAAPVHIYLYCFHFVKKLQAESLKNKINYPMFEVFF